MRRSVGTGIVAVLPGKLLKSLRNHTCHQVGGLFGGIPGVRFDIGSLWGLYKMHETLWFCLVSVLCSSAGRYFCRTIRLYVITAWW